MKEIEIAPAVAALAYCVHSMVATSPWMKFAHHERYRPTIDSGFGYVGSFLALGG